MQNRGPIHSVQSKRELPGDSTFDISKAGNEIQSSSLVPVLKIVAGHGAGKVIVLDRPITTIGRGTENDVVIEDTGVSRLHCRVLLEGERVALHDLDSTNGSLVRGKKIKSLELQDNTLVTLGTRVRLRFLWMSSEELVVDKQLYQGAIQDSTTGLLTRTGWDKSALEWAVSNPEVNFSVVLLNIAVPDPAADSSKSFATALPEFSKRLRNIGKNVLLGRFGHDEFGLLFPQLPEESVTRRLIRLQEESASGEDKLFIWAGLSNQHQHKGDDSKAHLNCLETALNQARTALKAAHQSAAKLEVYQLPPSKPQLPQRRRQSRLVCKLAVACSNNGQVQPGVVSEVSIGGMRLQTAVSYSVGQTVEVALKETPNDSVAVDIQWVRANGLHGCKFRESSQRLSASWVGATLRRGGIDSQSSQERRADLRVRATSAIQLVCSLGTYSCQLKDLGPGGLSVVGALVPAPGQQVEVQLADFRAQAEVLWSKAPECGLQFKRLNENQRVELTGLLRKAALHVTQSVSK